MENAADALKMAAAVLIFVLALSITISAFSEARQASDIILRYNDREYEETYIEEEKIINSSGNLITERAVGIESIIPSIYKAYKENYKIVFNIKDSGATISLYQKRNEKTGSFEERNYIDLQYESIAGGEKQKRIFINAILYGKDCLKTDYYKELNDNKSWDKIKYEFKILGIELNDDGLYKKIKNSRYRESLGVYYQEEVDKSDTTENSGTPDANKTKKRVITYSEI